MAETSIQTRLTKTAVDQALPILASGSPRQRIYLDTELRGFGLCVGARTKTFFVQRDIQGKSVRVTVGRYGLLTVAEARDRAREILVQMTRGVNPNRERERHKLATVTFGEALEMHLESNKRRAARTTTGYRYLADQYLSAWQKKPLAELSRNDCRERHRKIGQEHGPYAANSAFRLVRAVYNTALKVNEDLGPNPTIAVDWFPESRRKAAVASAKLADWYKEVVCLPNPIRRDYLLFVLFTGLRRENAATVRWADIDWEHRALLIPAPKSGRPFQLPLSDTVLALLRARRGCEVAQTVFKDSPWVFPRDERDRAYHGAAAGARRLLHHSRPAQHLHHGG